ncbi:MAG TPA: hypothetical protein VGQ57_04080 [Polyangiaceae bacterium]|jgi:hypothetical protein|nr:hypothetical protein [Polyangiaceae bacterium]
MDGTRRAFFMPIVLALAATFGCAGKQEPGGMGQDCYRDEDCKVGLVCVPDAAGKDRKCGNDVKGLASMVDGPPDAGVPADDGAVMGAGGAQ